MAKLVPLTPLYPNSAVSVQPVIADFPPFPMIPSTELPPPVVVDRIDPENLPSIPIAYEGFRQVTSWLREVVRSIPEMTQGSASLEAANRFRDSNYKYLESVFVSYYSRTIFTKTGKEEKSSTVESLANTIAENMRKPSSVVAVYPILKLLGFADSDHKNKRDVIVKAPTEGARNVYTFIVVGPRKKLVIKIALIEANRGHSVAGLIEGFDDCGEIFEYVFEDSGIGIDKDWLPTYDIKSGSKVITNITVKNLNAGTILETFGISTYYHNRKTDIFESLVRSPYFNLKWAKLSSDLQSTAPNPSPTLREFQEYVRSNVATLGPFKEVTNPALPRKARVAVSTAINNLAKVEAWVIQNKYSQELFDSKIEELQAYTGLSSGRVKSVMVKKYGAWDTIRVKVSQTVLSSSVANLAKLLGLTKAPETTAVVEEAKELACA